MRVFTSIESFVPITHLTDRDFFGVNTKKNEMKFNLGDSFVSIIKGPKNKAVENTQKIGCLHVISGTQFFAWNILFILHETESQSSKKLKANEFFASTAECGNVKYEFMMFAPTLS